jgi:flavin-dependent dehydrogenase
MAIQKKVDVLVIGAGPSGTIAAAIMNKAGLSVQVVEKMKFPRFVIGESLLPRCMEALDEAGFLDAVKEKHFQQKDGAKFVWGDKDCDFNFSQQFTEGWKWTWQVPRADFDKTLADECEKMGVPIAYETEVTAIDIAGDGSSKTTVRDKEGNEEVIEARFIVDGSGYGRVIPRMFGLERQSSLPPRKAFFCHLTDPKRSAAFEPNRIIIYVHNPKTWIWVIPFSNGNTSVGYVGFPEFFDSFEGTPEEIFRQLIKAEPQLAERFGESELLWEPRALQSWSVTTESFYGNGFVLTGNVTEFLDPVFSSGVTLASVSAQMAAKLVIRHLKGEQVDWQKEYMDPMLKGVDVFRTYVNGWYDGTLFTIFFADNRDPAIMSQICSVLAGYVWDEDNSFVKNHEKNVRTLARFLETTNTTA